MKTVKVEAAESYYINLIDGVFSSKDISERNKYDLAVEYRTEAIGYFHALLDLDLISVDEFDIFKRHTFNLIYDRSSLT